MIVYEFGSWGVCFAVQLRGSVFPQGLVFAVPCTMCAMGYWYYFNKYLEEEERPNIGGASSLWSGYTFVLGFLLVFRTQIAYSRFWEGGSVLQEMRGVWLNATSSLVAFCTRDPAKKEQVMAFQHLLVRIMSLMHCSAIQEVADMADENFDILETNGLNFDSMEFLLSLSGKDRVEVAMQWIQRLIVNDIQSGVLNIAPPILSRVYQELATGILKFQGAKKIAEFPFPFPYAQMLTVMLFMHWVLAPIMAALVVEDLAACGMVTFVNSFSFWCINYIAAEIEMPFGDNPNDLPVEELQLDFNSSLSRLMNPLVQSPPEFRFDKEMHTEMQLDKMSRLEGVFKNEGQKELVKRAAGAQKQIDMLLGEQQKKQEEQAAPSGAVAAPSPQGTPVEAATASIGGVASTPSNGQAVPLNVAAIPLDLVRRPPERKTMDGPLIDRGAHAVKSGVRITSEPRKGAPIPPPVTDGFGPGGALFEEPPGAIGKMQDPRKASAQALNAAQRTAIGAAAMQQSTL
eukprot:TRINITY_DN29626_c0_g2_i1.p1 TRINITY_DN29626_c0_g2~~TRINITY_DN29626_c0_g2_i1.p1  ORF type:complete len:514 (+),score=122.50 TRINITY_DN29626_c0_g2_i1:137-1678(+)